MIRREPGPEGTVKLTFELPADFMQGMVSVVGDFNDWQAGVTTFRGRGSIRSATVEVESGRRYAFRYVTEAGQWIDDESSDSYERDDQGFLSGGGDLTSNVAGLRRPLVHG